MSQSDLTDIILQEYNSRSIAEYLGDKSITEQLPTQMPKIWKETEELSGGRTIEIYHTRFEHSEPQEITLTWKYDDIVIDDNTPEYILNEIGFNIGIQYTNNEKTAIINQILTQTNESVRSESGKLDSKTLREALESLEFRADILIIPPNQHSALIDNNELFAQREYGWGETPFIGFVSNKVDVLVSPALTNVALLYSKNDMKILKTELEISILNKPPTVPLSVKLKEWCNVAPIQNYLTKILFD